MKALLAQLQLPNQKEWAAGVGGIIAFLIILGFQLAGIQLDDTVESALIVVLPAVLAKIVPPSDGDVLKHLNDDIAQAGVLIGKVTQTIVQPTSTTELAPTQAAADLARKA